MSNPAISEKWIKASIIGTIWAASEIVLGSFLHNLRIPFSSNFLTGIGIIILISSSYKWTERGLFWRAGLICALMKTMSPSAVIFGPMVAIFSQSLLLDLATRVLGRNVIGFLTGAMLAMTWNLFHKIMNFIIYYGFNITNIYSDLVKYAQKQLNIDFDLVWSPIIALAAIYAILGLIAGITGIKVGRRLLKQPVEAMPAITKQYSGSVKTGKEHFDYSVIWLVINIILIVTAFILLNSASWPVWSVAITVIIVVWIMRYKRALRQLSRPRLWIYFVLITMGTSFVMGKIQSCDLMMGLETGIKMNFRATIVILGFSVLGTELYNRKVRDFFVRSVFRQLPLALELSLKSLPMMIATVPEMKTIARNPVLVICSVISQIELRLKEARMDISKHIYIITGTIGQGKTTQSHRLTDLLKEKGVTVSGIYSPRIMENDKTTGYDIVDIETGIRVPFLRLENNSGYKTIGKYSINPGALRAGTDALTKAMEGRPDVIIVDEIGKMELGNEGWYERITGLISRPAILVFAIRDSFVDDIVRKWEIKNYSVRVVSEDLYLELGDLIEQWILQRKGSVV